MKVVSLRQGAKVIHGRKLVFCELKVMRGDDIIAKEEAIAYGKEFFKPLSEYS